MGRPPAARRRAQTERASPPRRPRRGAARPAPRAVVRSAPPPPPARFFPMKQPFFAPEAGRCAAHDRAGGRSRGPPARPARRRGALRLRPPPRGRGPSHRPSGRPVQGFAAPSPRPSCALLCPALGATTTREESGRAAAARAGAPARPRERARTCAQRSGSQLRADASSATLAHPLRTSIRRRPRPGAQLRAVFPAKIPRRPGTVSRVLAAATLCSRAAWVAARHAWRTAGQSAASPAFAFDPLCTAVTFPAKLCAFSSQPDRSAVRFPALKAPPCARVPTWPFTLPSAPPCAMARR